jgi:hypothetical protein
VTLEESVIVPPRSEIGSSTKGFHVELGQNHQMICIGVLKVQHRNQGYMCQEPFYQMIDCLMFQSEL